MANWIGVSRTNYFKVKDEEAFLKAMESLPVDVWGVVTVDGSTAYGLGAEPNEGSWPIEDDEGKEIAIEDLVASHLAEGEVAVFMSAGFEKQRYVSGNAVAVDSTGKRVRISLNDIYDRAHEAFGVRPTAAEY